MRRLDDVPGWVDWVVIVRRDDSGIVYYYAYRPRELHDAAAKFPEPARLAAATALDLHEWDSSVQARGRRALGAPHSPSPSPANGRVVDFDAAGRITGGRRISRTRALSYWGTLRAGDIASDTGFDLGPLRGGHRLPSGPPPTAPTPPLARVGGDPGEPAEIDVTISAETRPEIDIGARQRVDFRIELAAEAMPLAEVLPGPAVHAKVTPIVVLLSVENGVLEIVGVREITVQPPGRGQPTSGNFAVKGVTAGVTRLAVTFRQGGSELGVIALAVEVVAGGAKAGATQGCAIAAPADPTDDDKLAVMIEQRNENGRVFYHYTLHSEALNLQYEAFELEAAARPRQRTGK